jgi:hypothetical protein
VHVLVGPLTVVWVASAAVTYLGLFVAIASLVVRSRRARGMERQQLRWVALAAWLSVLALMVIMAGLVLGSDAIINWAGGVLVAILPLGTGAAILRYRLYDLDRIISRTVAYGLLSVLLGGGYAAILLGLGQLLGRDSSLVVAAATLVVAAAFQPARRRIQQGVDRRFQPPPPRRRPHHRRLQRPPARPGRPDHPDRRAAGRGRPDHAANPGVAVRLSARVHVFTLDYGGTTEAANSRRSRLTFIGWRACAR